MGQDGKMAGVGRVDGLIAAIGRRIVAGDFKPGEALPIEQDLSAQFGTGRNAVREAVKVLAGKGFVRTERRLGTIVEPRRHWAMLDPEVLSWMLETASLRTELLEKLSQLRRVIEPEIAALAAEHATIPETLRIFEAFGKMEEHRHDRERAIASDIEFHMRLFDASHNPLFISMSRSIDVLLRANFEISIQNDQGFIRNLAQHGKVAEAIHRHDAKAARREMLKLLSNNDADLKEMLAG